MAEAMIANRRQPTAGNSLERPVNLELSFFHKAPPRPGKLILTLRRDEGTLKIYFDGQRCYALSSN